MANTNPETQYIEILISDRESIPKALNAVSDEFAVGPKQSITEKVVNKVVRVDVDVIKDNINNTCQALMTSLSEINTENSKFEIGEVTFNLVFDKKGAVKLWSVAEGEVSSQAGISITLKPKKNG